MLCIKNKIIQQVFLGKMQRNTFLFINITGTQYAPEKRKKPYNAKHSMRIILISYH